jgi:transcriptional regulator with XRE-family HTH domain
VNEASAYRDLEEPVGAALARMRRAKGLTGAQLGRLAKMSQPKISRIETGRGLVDPKDVGRLARALGADDELARRLMERAEAAHNRRDSWQPLPTLGLAGTQNSMGEWEASVQTLRAFEPTIVQGLLQTSEYARAILTAFQKLVPDLAENSDSAILEAVSARMRRQEILSDTSRSFVFVMTESVLVNQFCPPDDMLGQIRRLREVNARYTNVSIRVVPEHATYVIPPMNGFELFDDRAVVADVFNIGLSAQGPADIRLYRSVFDSFEAASVGEIEPILDKYYRSYARQLVPDEN